MHLLSYDYYVIGFLSVNKYNNDNDVICAKTLDDIIK